MRQAAATGAVSLFGDLREWSRELALAGIAGLFFGLVGPFGSYLNASRLVVIAYWVGAVLFGTVLFGLTLRPAVRLAPRLLLPPVGVLVPALLLTALPMALACHTVAAWIWPIPIARIGFGLWYAQTLVISTPLAACYLLTAAHTTRPRSLPPAPAEVARDELGTATPASGPGFLGRLPAALGRDLVALQMEDHYVRAHTMSGSALILIPLHQAIAELAPASGLRIHRSWWVATAAVTRAIQDGRNLRLALSNGIQAPVSRANVTAVRAAGLL